MSLEQPENQETTPNLANSPNPFSPQNGGFGGMQIALPNATAVLVLGILSIVTCCCYGVIGLIAAIVAIVLSKKDRVLYLNNTNAYTEGSFKNLNAGRICAIIGLILSLLVVIFYSVLFFTIGFKAMSDPKAIQEILDGMK
jgi:hypothetical protein